MCFLFKNTEFKVALRFLFLCFEPPSRLGTCEYEQRKKKSEAYQH